jgi:hypothetical protein
MSPVVLIVTVVEMAEAKALPLHATGALGKRGCIAPTHRSRR